MRGTEGLSKTEDEGTTILNGKISVIIVTYNAAATLQSCLNSIYQQTYPYIEIIIIDGNSTDDTLKIIEENKAKIAYYKSEPDTGIYDAMNKAITHITGNWAYFLGSDDELYPDFSKLANELKDPDTIYYANVRTRGVIRSGELDAYKHAKHGVFHQAMIYPASVFKKYTYNTRYRIYADYALNMKCWKDASIKFAYKNHIVAHFNHTGASGNVKDNEFDRDKSSLIFENFGLLIWLRYRIRNLKSRK
jgi:glycosyltransferase involved in cell wall biosynthesis